MPPPRKHNRLTRDIRAFSGFKFYLGDLNITVILNLFQKFVIQKLGGNTESFKIHYEAGTTTSSRNNLQNSCKTQVAGAAATMPQRGEGINKKRLKRREQSDVQNDVHLQNPLPQSLPQGREAEKHAAFTLAEGATHVVHFDDIRRAAFTLAEVLITLGIIGVVAAMTMPSVIGHYKKQETISKLKKAYTSINQALKMSEIDNGEYEYWDEGFGLGAEQYLQKYWLPYFNVLKICKSYDECGYQSVYPWTLLNGNQSSLIFSNPNYRIPFITTDGILYSISIAKGEDDDYTTNSQIHIDINSSKGPNIYGKDIFVFTRVKDKGILPYCYEYTDNKIASSCSKTGDGTCCSQLIMMNGWQFPKDYPY